ncbi:hypothetical protein BG004_001883, partial [Podila humilis]
MDWTSSQPGGFSFSNPSNKTTGFTLNTTKTSTTTTSRTSTNAAATTSSLNNRNVTTMDTDTPGNYPSRITGNMRTTTASTKASDIAPSIGTSFGKSSNATEYQKFAQALEKLQAQDKAADQNTITYTLERFEELCSESARQQGRNMGGDNELAPWLAESSTWLLLAMLVRSHDDITMLPAQTPKNLTDKQLIDRLQRNDAEFRHHLTVKAWFQEIAPSFTQTIATKKYGTTSLNIGRSSFSFQNPSQQGTTLSQIGPYHDPDAITRDGTQLSAANQSAERNLLRTAWEYIRRGDLQEAKAACVKAGEHWRADSISGGELYTELPAFSELDTGRTQGPQGNKSRSLWKGTCYALARDSSADPYERAIYGALSGDVNSSIPVCGGWEDQAWVYYNALVEKMIESELSTYHRGDPCSDLPLPKIHVDDAKDVFAAIDSSNKPYLEDLSKDLFFRVQRSIILGNSAEMLSKLANEARKSYNMGVPTDPYRLRFLAHFVLVLRSRGLNVSKDDGDYFVKTFTEYLIDQKMYDVAPLYASFLPKDLQIKTCSDFLKNYNGKWEDREKQVANLRKYGLDLHNILVATVDQLLATSRKEIEQSTDFVSTLHKSILEPTTKQEREVVRILEWLTFDPSGRTECLKRSNDVLRKYL